MNLLFKLSTSSSDGGNVVINSNFKQHYSGVNDNLSWETLEPCIRKATEEYILPVLGRTFYDDIALKFTNGDTLDETQTLFLSKLQDVVAYYTVFYGAPELNISISDMGLGERGASNSSVYPTSQWRYKNFMWDVCSKADRMMDSLIAFMDQAVADGEAYFDPWKSAPGYAQSKSVFFNSAQLFSQYQQIGSSRRLFNAIHQEILDAEFRVLGLICSDMNDDLKAKIIADNLNDEEKALVHCIRKFVAARALSHSIPRLPVYIDGRGLFLSSFTDGFESKSSHAAVNRGAETVGAFGVKLTSDAEAYFDQLAIFIHDNIDDYTLIKDSDCYAEYNQEGSMPICTGPGGVML